MAKERCFDRLSPCGALHAAVCTNGAYSQEALQHHEPTWKGHARHLLCAPSSPQRAITALLEVSRGQALPADFMVPAVWLWVHDAADPSLMNSVRPATHEVVKDTKLLQGVDTSAFKGAQSYIHQFGHVRTRQAAPLARMQHSSANASRTILCCTCKTGSGALSALLIGASMPRVADTPSNVSCSLARAARLPCRARALCASPCIRAQALFACICLPHISQAQRTALSRSCTFFYDRL